MRHRPLLSTITLGMLLSACSSSPWWPQTAEHVSIRSQPPGAEVYLMGEKVGQTPMQLDPQAIFPHTYEPKLEALYGQVELRKAGCSPLRLAVSNRHIEQGIEATLTCTHFAPPAPAGRRPTAERLQELQQLREAELIDESEYRRLRQRILDAL